MNRLATAKRAQILGMLVEGMSMRATSRVAGVSINTVAKLLKDAGEAAAAYHDEHVREISAARIQCDEIWSFVYAKKKNVGSAKTAPEWAGDVWTWTALDADSKLLISWMLGGRDVEAATALMMDLRARVAGRAQITTDGLPAYIEAVEAAFGGDVDYAMLVKDYSPAPPGRSQPDTVRYSPGRVSGSRRMVVQGNPDPQAISTSLVERHNLTMRMGMRRFTRLTNGFSKRVERHAAQVALFVLHYNFCRIHKTLRCTPAMEAGIDTTVRDSDWIVGLVDARAPKPRRPKTYRKREVSN